MASRTIYGAELFQSQNNEVNYHTEAYGKNSETIAQGDILSVGAAGMRVYQAHGTVATEPIFGIAAKAYTISATNTAVALVKPYFIPAYEDYIFLMGTNSDLSKTTSLGVYYALTSASGAASNTGTAQVDVSLGAQTMNGDSDNRVVVCVGVDPNNEGGSGANSGLRQGLFKFISRNKA